MIAAIDYVELWEILLIDKRPLLIPIVTHSSRTWKLLIKILIYSSKNKRHFLKNMFHS